MGSITVPEPELELDPLSDLAARGVIPPILTTAALHHVVDHHSKSYL
jgi:hypothetical protein